MTSMPEGVLDRRGLQVLLDVLRAGGWSVIGPVVRDGVITHAEVSSLDEMPRGVRDVQDCASYRLHEHGGESLLGYAVGPESWKSILFPSRQLLRRARTRAGEPLDQTAPPDSTTSPIALFGVRSCDLHAIAKLDDVLLGRQAIDAHYAARRASVLVIAVSCSDPGGTCFCASMGTGPEPQEDFDLALTELLDVEGHRFLIRGGRPRQGGGRGRRGIGHRTHGAPPRHGRPARPALCQRPASAVDERRRPVPGLQQLHDGLPDLLLHLGGGLDRSSGRLRRARARMGLVLHQ
jgi:hypothetical protein